MSLKDKETKERNAAEARFRNKPLSKRERRFAAHVHRGMTNLDAALQAGYPETSAHTRACELRADPRIQLLLSQMAEKEVSLDVPLDQEYVLQRLRRMAELSILRGRDASALRALELLGKYLKMFSDRVETTHGIPENLAQLIAEARARAAKPDKPVVIEDRPLLQAPPPPED